MKRVLLTVVLAAISLGASAQVFDFSLNSPRFELGLNLGQAEPFSSYKDFGMGVSLLAWGVYADMFIANAQHKYDHHVSDTQWNDTEAVSVNLGYQVPVVKWLRIMPLVGYSQTNDGITDGSTINFSSSDSGTTFSHDYIVTPGSRRHYFNYGGGLSIQPLKWFSINAIVTRHAIYGGIAIDFFGFAKEQ